MNITVKSIIDGSPLSGLAVKVDGSSVGTTDSSGQITGATSGCVLEVTDKFKADFSDPADDRQVWIDNETSGGGMGGDTPPGGP